MEFWKTVFQDPFETGSILPGQTLERGACGVLAFLGPLRIVLAMGSCNYRQSKMVLIRRTRVKYSSACVVEST